MKTQIFSHPVKHGCRHRARGICELSRGGSRGGGLQGCSCSFPTLRLKRGLCFPEPSIWHLSQVVNFLKKRTKQSFNCTFCFSLHSGIMAMALIQCCIEHVPALRPRDRFCFPLFRGTASGEADQGLNSEQEQ